MSEMVERVARALAAVPMHGDYEFVPVDEVFTRPRYSHLAEQYRGQARAAIATMREPTFDPDAVSYHEGMSRADWWRAMIDAALGA